MYYVAGLSYKEIIILYSRIPVFRTPLGQLLSVKWLLKLSSFQRYFCTLCYVVGTVCGVLINGDVLGVLIEGFTVIRHTELLEVLWYIYLHQISTCPKLHPSPRIYVMIPSYFDQPLVSLVLEVGPRGMILNLYKMSYMYASCQKVVYYD